MVPLWPLIAVSLVLLASPVVWVACINIVGLRRLQQRLDLLENDVDYITSKSRSLQAQISKKSRKPAEVDQDEEINNEITASIKNTSGNSRELSIPERGGIF